MLLFTDVSFQAVAAEREKELQRAADNSRSRGGGGGGRMNLGRGDARNYSGRCDHQQSCGLELAHRAGDFAENFVGHGFGRLEHAATAGSPTTIVLLLS